MTRSISYERDTDGIVVITFDHPSQKQNVIDAKFAADFAYAIERLEADEEAKGAVICSGKPAFMAGADLKELEALLFTTDRSLDAIRIDIENFKSLLRRLEHWPHPVAAAINGHALGGGYEICLACNRRIAADSDGIAIGLPEVTVGLLPGGGGIQRLTQLVGAETALPFLLEGKTVNPQAALQAGLVDELAPADELLQRARQWVLLTEQSLQPWDRPGFVIPGGSSFAGGAVSGLFVAANAASHARSQGNYPASLAILSAMYEGLKLPLDTALDIETDYYLALLADPATKNIVRTSFISKKAADGLTRRPVGIDRSKVHTVGILGAGLMGAGIAYCAAAQGIDVILLDRDHKTAELGKDYARRVIERRFRRNAISEPEAASLLDRIHVESDFAELEIADLVIEAVFEDQAIKAEVHQRAEQVMRDGAILATNTSALPITELAKAVSRPSHFIGLHFFSPVERMQLVEIIKGEKTSDDTLARSMDFIAQLRKTPIIVNDSRGFYTSRCFGTFTDEGVHMLAEGVPPALIENAARSAGMPVGPLAVSDEVALDLVWQVIETDRQLNPGHELSAAGLVIDHMVNKLSRLGRKSGGGFYTYPEAEQKKLWEGLAQEFPRTEKQLDIDKLRQRILYRQALEAARCYCDGVIEDAADADLGAVLGWGFPAYTGGPLLLIDNIGLPEFVETMEVFADEFGSRFAPPARLARMAEEGGSFYTKQ